MDIGGVTAKGAALAIDRRLIQRPAPSRPAMTTHPDITNRCSQHAHGGQDLNVLSTPSSRWAGGCHADVIANLNIVRAICKGDQLDMNKLQHGRFLSHEEPLQTLSAPATERQELRLD